MPYDRQRFIKETVTSAQVIRDHGGRTRPDGPKREAALCPFHDDTGFSLKLYSHNGYMCFACREAGDARSLEQYLGDHESLSRAASKLEERHNLVTFMDPIWDYPLSQEARKQGKVVRRKEVARWTIRDENGEPCAFHILYETQDAKGVIDKEHAYCSPDDAEDAIEAEEVPLYLSERAERYEASGNIILVEGEEVADAACSAWLRVVATAERGVVPVRKRLEFLRRRRVTLWPHNDEAGRKHMAQVAEALQGIAAEVRWFEWNGAPEGGTAADHPAVISGDLDATFILEPDLIFAPHAKPQIDKYARGLNSGPGDDVSRPAEENEDEGYGDPERAWHGLDCSLEKLREARKGYEEAGREDLLERLEELVEETANGRDEAERRLDDNEESRW